MVMVDSTVVAVAQDRDPRLSKRTFTNGKRRMNRKKRMEKRTTTTMMTTMMTMTWQWIHWEQMIVTTVTSGLLAGARVVKAMGTTLARAGLRT
jgi:hypothetical protein